jgi:hypothetical protein
MIFSKPEFYLKSNSYHVRVNDKAQFSYTESRLKSSGDSFYNTVNVNNESFKTVVNKFADAIYKEGSSWFATPIKSEIFLKKVKHIFDEIPSDEKKAYGNNVLFTWVPYKLEIISKSFEISWEISKYETHDLIIPSNFIDISEELEVHPRTIVIQQNEIIENAEIPFDNSEQDIHTISSRAAGMLLKQKVRKAKLKAAIATMKAERMAEKYFRRYGVQTDLDSDSDLSFDSGEENSEEE